MSEQVALIGTFRVPPERMAEANAAFVRIVADSCAEDGCLAYSYGIDPGDPGLVHVMEIWESWPHLEAHFATPHMARWREERAGLGFHDKRLRRYAIDEGVDV